MSDIGVEETEVTQSKNIRITFFPFYLFCSLQKAAEKKKASQMVSSNCKGRKLRKWQVDWPENDQTFIS